MSYRLFFILVASTLCAAGGQILLKMGAKGQTNLVDFLNSGVFFGLALYLVGTALWLLALSRLPLQVVYPFTLLTFLVVGIGSFFFLHEVPSKGILGGWVLIALGLAVVSVSMIT